ncbi:ly6/PLAUR domain-containing protein 5 [Prionailurus bengalensis]|uniref:ly6/PLAUR domain-containing protein 5 n=1 Tax=Prionailurus bengalensis TaxID=37029 RepID=UPI001CA812E7|nr:ly6/PLAUR domain-containing protein 5 [Prionailurus bengalensis]
MGRARHTECFRVYECFSLCGDQPKPGRAGVEESQARAGVEESGCLGLSRENQPDRNQSRRSCPRCLSSAQLCKLAMGVPRTIVLFLFGAVFCLTESQAQQCYSFQHIYFGPFDLSAVKFHNISCPHGCSEAVLSLDTGYRATVTVVQKGCWTGPPTGQMLSDGRALPPDYSVVRGCTTDLCNADLMTHDAIPNLSPAPNPPTLSGMECYACLGIHPEDCTPEKSRRVQCHQDQSVCFQGNGQMTVGNFSVPVYIRTCHRPSCTIKGTSSPWTNIDLQGSCCEGQLCNRDSVTQSFTTASAAATPSQAPHGMALLLMVPLLAATLGGPLLPSS